MSERKIGYFWQDGQYVLYTEGFWGALEGRGISFRCGGNMQADGNPPLALLQEYEKLLGYKGEPQPETINVVEVLASIEGEYCGFDQPCTHGRRVENHAVYCHNTSWLYAPRKCWRSSEYPHDQCAGYAPNRREN